jgi:hypothetical protein
MSLLVLLSSLSALANCPPIAGEFVLCKSTSRASMFSLSYVGISSSTETNPAFKIHIVSKTDNDVLEVIPDGVLREVKVTDPELGEFKLNHLASCDEVSLKIETTAEIMGDLREKMTFESTPDGIKIMNFLDDELMNETNCSRI